MDFDLADNILLGGQPVNAVYKGTTLVWPFTPERLFRSGEQGVWYDPSDMATMFQDAAGTIPVTAVEQPVGRILDKSGRGNHASQSTSSSRPVLSARVNMLLATETLATQSVTTLATQYTLRFTGTGSITLSGTATGAYTAGTHTITCTAGTLTLTVSGTVTQADLREANINYDLPSYQRVNTATDYVTVGFKPYLKFDGSDDFLVTSNIDFTATDKVGIFAGLRKLSDTGAGNVVELSTATDTNNGSFAVTAPDSASATFAFESKGTVLANRTVGEVAAPVTGLFTCIGNIAGDNATVRFNGLEISTLSDQGTGNYGNYPLYIGRRAGTTLPFNGHIYSLVIRGEQTIDSTLEKMERYVNQKTNALDWDEISDTAAFRWNSATASPDAE